MFEKALEEFLETLRKLNGGKLSDKDRLSKSFEKAWNRFFDNHVFSPIDFGNRMAKIIWLDPNVK